MDYREIYDYLYKYTDGFTKEAGELPFEDKKEVETAKKILSNHYDDTYKGLSEDVELDGTDYTVTFEKPLDSEGELVYRPTVGPEGPMGVAVESYINELRDLEPLTEDIEKHDDLNPKLFLDGEIREDVKQKLLFIVNKFHEALLENDIDLDIKDVVIIGSNASYNYNKDSDIDTHIVADLSKYKGQEDLAMKIYQAYKSLWNAKYDPMIRGMEVELYVEPEEIRAKSNGQYSLYNGWIKVPVKNEIPEVDEDEVNNILKPYIERAESCETISDIDSLIDGIYLERQQGILTGGEYSPNNLAFKEFRSRGYLTDLRKKKVELENNEMSLESLNTMVEVLGG